jgi:hypothetical protein
MMPRADPCDHRPSGAKGNSSSQLGTHRFLTPSQSTLRPIEKSSASFDQTKTGVAPGSITLHHRRIYTAMNHRYEPENPKFGDA